MTKVLITLISILVLSSCGKDKKEEQEPGLFDIIEGVSDLRKVADEAEKIEEDNEKLMNTKPISNEEIKAFLPEQILEYPRKKFSIGNQFMSEIRMGEAEYESENGQKILLSIIDGAGEAGSSMIMLARLGFTQDFEEQNERGYKKSTTINGYKATEEIEKDAYNDGENSKIELLIANRFLVSMEGDQVSLNELKKGFSQLNSKKLEEKAN
ncbi:hypothetical protein [Aquimarina muelleri]|uniref:Lipoprotein n=1 Tax=Aquimarina muelleri TaxID=279356 RepID=A0A918JSS4_9FLAO|nr:hypothetical protein [Aquimarina muelleri]MCX2762054.1 hypothetical protein [Aquimarina muelleri]GGX04101.1 hypothetical protein GCM10007384_02360 [Aquimarina muelleri]